MCYLNTKLWSSKFIELDVCGRPLFANPVTYTVMWFSIKVSKRHQYPSIVVGDSPLRVVDEQKYLGLVFDNHLTWTSHVSQVCKKMAYYLHLLNRHKHVINAAVMKMLINCLVLSHLHYALTVWGPLLNVQLQSCLQSMLNRSVHLALSLRKYDYISNHFKHLGWLPLQELIQFHCLCSMFAQCHQHRCIPLDPPIVFGHQHVYDTRRPDIFASVSLCHLSLTR